MPRNWSPVGGTHGPRDGAPMVWGRNAGMWGWLDFDLADFIITFNNRLGVMRGWFPPMQNQITALMERVERLEQATGVTASSTEQE